MKMNLDLARIYIIERPRAYMSLTSRSAGRRAQGNANPMEIDSNSEHELKMWKEKLKDQTDDQGDLMTSFQSRWMRSKVRDYWLGESLSQQSADDAVNTFTLINALVLTIPVALIGYMTYEFWDWVKSTNDANCPDKDLYDTLYDAFTFRLATIFTTCGSSLGIGLLYFTLRPEGGKDGELSEIRKIKNDIFHAWWKQGKYIMLILVLSSVLTSILTYMMLAYMLSTVVNSTGSLCDNYEIIRYGWGGGGYFTFVVLLCLVLMY